MRLSVYDFVQYDFFGAVTDVVHPAHPFKLIRAFEGFHYTTFPDYTIKSKRDTGYLGRFTYKMIKEFRGFNRILTIIARGYMWETDEPDVDRAYRALCAWCSLPESVKPDKRKAGQDRSCFADLHNEFPELVNEDGAGWYFTHIHNIIEAVLENTENNTQSMADTRRYHQTNAGTESGFNNNFHLSRRFFRLTH